MSDAHDIADQQRERWRRALERGGGTPAAVGSESMAHKRLRYARVSQVFGDDTEFSVHDVGCGVGDYRGYLDEFLPDRRIEYSGSDLLDDYLAIARERFPGTSFVGRDMATAPNVYDERYDYVVLSGVFHQKGSVAPATWFAYMASLLDVAFAISRRGIAFNLMSHYADYYDADLFYPPLTDVLDHLVSRLSRHFEVDHATPLFESTIRVYHPGEVARRYPAPELSRYLSTDGGSDAS